jgi:putative transposase
VVKPARRRLLVGHLKDRYRISERRACAALRFCRASMRYRGKVSIQNQVLLARIKEIAAARVRYGFRRIHVLLKREGWSVNVKRLRRLYHQEGLSLRARAPKRRRSAQLRQPQYQPTAANEVWCMDFMHDRLATPDRRPIRLLTVVDIFTRECLGLEVAYGFRARDVTSVLSRILARRGKPQAIRCDNGTEFTATAFDQWAYANSITIDYSRPGKPTDNAFIESFNGRVRQELLNACWFDTIESARRAARNWRHDYNVIRPHRSLGYKTPREFAAADRKPQSEREKSLIPLG